MAEPLLVVGLGNPGPQYAKTRHNVGFMVADLLAGRIGAAFKVHKKSGAEIVTGRLGHKPVVLAKPRTYMNESGRQVGPLAKFYSVSPADVIVIHDELDIDFGQIRLKLGGGEGGHNGLRSVANALGTKDFQRVRIGIGRPPGRKDPAAYRAGELLGCRAPRGADPLRDGRRRQRTADRVRPGARAEPGPRLVRRSRQESAAGASGFRIDRRHRRRRGVDLEG